MSILDVNLPDQRVIPFSSVSNFRDIGGYSGADHRQVKWEQIYRSAHLCGLDDNDIQKLQALGVRQSIDLRGQKESQRNHYAYEFLQRQACVIEPEVARLVNEYIAVEGAISVADAHRFMHEMYTSFFTHYTAQFSAFFKHVMQAQSPLVVHCTAGKDRTGFACAMLLTALGVHDDDILEDYLLTQQCYNVELKAREGVDLQAMKVLWGVSSEYLEQALHNIRQARGTVSAFLHKGLGVGPADTERLQAKLLA